jgi:putative redox protein
MDMVVSFPGGVRVNAEYKGFTIESDQPKNAGGEGSAPAPFDLFLASIATCAGYYVMSFCQKRNIRTDDIRLVMKAEWNRDAHLISIIAIDINLPDNFPEKYKRAVIASADKCTVKRNMMNAPNFEIRALIGKSE